MELKQSTPVSKIKGCSTFQPPEEGQSVQRPKHCDKHGNKDEDNSLKNVNNVHNTSSQKYRQFLYGLVGRVFANGPEDLGSIPGRVIPKT